MLETSVLRKNKINLTDYDYEQDIKNRLLMSNFSTLDFSTLEEILFSPIKISLKKLLDNLSETEENVLPVLLKFQGVGLLTIEGDTLTVDKEMRKYYEAQIVKFEEDFTPGMEFLQSLLRKVPIHVLPMWYSIPRTSNNIFDSLVEKYLLTPQIFQRYLIELQFTDPNLNAILQEVYQSPELKVSAASLIEKYDLTREQFEEYMLQLEFHLVCCLRYEKMGDYWREIVTPFSEWCDYIKFIKSTEAVSIENVSEVQRKRKNDFAFIEDLTALIQIAKKKPFKASLTSTNQVVVDKQIAEQIASKLDNFPLDSATTDISHLLSKLRRFKLAEVIDGQFYALEAANDWLDMRQENRAIYLYRHQLINFITDHLPFSLASERNVREAEKSILRVLSSGWVYFDEFLKGVLTPLSDGSMIGLHKQGKSWKYSLPDYTSEEKQFIQAVVCNWLPEIGVVATGTHQGRECFIVTPFGQTLFGR